MARSLIDKLAPLIRGKRKRAEGAPMGRFVILGLPRSGTTYLMGLLNAHRDITCSGEAFNPHAIVDINTRDDSAEAVLARDGDPVGHMRAVFAAADAQGVAQGGFKFMLGHNVAVLEALLADPDLRIIHVWRENRLAQVASFIKAVGSKKWAQTRTDDYVHETIHARPRQIAQRWHDYATMDFMAGRLLAAGPQPVLTLEYRDLFGPDIPARLCEFLCVEPDPDLKSPLVKQGANRVIDRFAKPGPIAHYFRQIGRADWLEEEL